MAVVLHPWQILVATMAGWITRQQDAVIETPGPNEAWMMQIEPDDRPGSTSRVVDCAQRLGGMLRFYHRAAA